MARAQKEAGRGTELPVQRFLAEVRKNESQKLIVAQKIIEVQNKINFLVGRFPQQVKREGWDFIKLDSSMLSVGVPAMLLQNRRDIVAAERELEAAGLDILVARAEFYPKLDITAGVGFEAFNPRFLFDPGSFVANAAGELVAPLINRKAIQAEYMNANARQLQALYDYQRTVINAFTEVVNSMNKVQNYRERRDQAAGGTSAGRVRGGRHQPVSERSRRVCGRAVLATRPARSANHIDRDQAAATVGHREGLSGAGRRILADEFRHGIP